MKQVEKENLESYSQKQSKTSSTSDIVAFQNKAKSNLIHYG